MAILFKNNAASTLTYKMTDVQEVLYVADASVFPVIASDSGDTFKLTLVGEDTLEIVEAFEVHNSEGRQGFKIRRAQEGTTAQAWPAGTRVEMRITADALNSFVPTAVQLAKDYVDATGVASTTNVGFAGVDGKTTQADAGGVITAKDVAIGGDLRDLASARGQIGNSKTQGSHDFSSGMLSEKPGMYTAMNSGSTNVPFTGPFAEMILGTPTYRGSLLITSGRPSFPRAAISAISKREGEGFSGYNRLITEQQVGDGIRVSNGIISVPEYDGATASTAGTAGLVPPAAAGEQESFLTGGGEYKPALTKISDSVSLEDSTTAASAKAVKTAYDLASAALPKSGGTISGNISVVGGITVAAPDGESDGGQILLKNGTDGSYPVVIDTTQNQIRFLSGPGGPGGFVSVDLETVRFVGNLTGKADSAHLADNTYSLAGRPWLEDLYTDSPGWVIGSVDEQLRPINTGSLKVLAADRIISGSFAYGRASDGFYLPNGGSWFVFCILDNDVSHGSVNAIPIMAAGGSHITWSFNGTGYTWIGIKVL